MPWPWSKRRAHREAQLGPVALLPIGHVQNSVTRPRPRGWEQVDSRLVILPEHEPKLEGIEAYSHIIVVFWMDLAPGAPEKPDQITLGSGNTYGILATRSQLRPNHLGVSVVPLLGRDGCVLQVRGLDAIDGTPVLDLKPYLPEYDALPAAHIPDA
jgi:tRNA-Thr(GGU) m(6)t(6)A37 methyltransferase TsaA